MKRSRCLLVLLTALALSFSFVVPAEDIPETPYDESESLPYESTPSSSIVLQQSACSLQVAPTLSGDSRPMHHAARTQLAGFISECVIIFDLPLRC